MGAAVWAYIDLTAMEGSGGSRQAPWILAFLYNYLGKWGIVALLGLGGLGAILHGVSQLFSAPPGRSDEPPRKRKKPRRPRDAGDEE